MRAVDIGVELELVLDLVDQRWLGGEDEIDEVAAVQRAGGIGEVLAVQPLHLLDIRAFFFEFALS